MHRLIALTIIVSLPGIGNTFAATFETVTGGAELDRGVFVTQTEDGGYVALGVTRSFGKGEEDLYLVRLDPAGKILWTRTYGGEGSDNGWALHGTPGGFTMAGFTSSSGAGGFDCYLLKTDAAGELQWSKTFGGEGEERCWGLSPTKSGGYLLVGETTGTGAGEEDCLLVRTDSSGREIWSRTYGGPKGDRCFAITPAEDGGALLVGQTYSEGAGDRDVYVIRTDPSGRKSWSKTFGGAASDVGHSITRARDGRFVVFGYTTSLAPAGDDPYLVKIDDGGMVVWTRVLSMEGINHTLTGDLAADGGFYLTGFSEDRRTGTRMAIVVKTDVDGRLEWHEDILPTRTGESLGYTVRSTPDGGCVLTGHTTEKSAGGRDLLVVKVDKPPPPPATRPAAPPGDG